LFIVVRTDIDVMVTGIVKDQLVVFFCSTLPVALLTNKLLFFFF